MPGGVGRVRAGSPPDGAARDTAGATPDTARATRDTTGAGPDAGALARDAEDLVRRLRRWTAASWTLPPQGPGPATRADAAHLAVQRIADLGADAELRLRLPVPRLADPVLADQLAVVVDDVVRTGDPTAVRGTAAVLRALRLVLALR
jgi:hypothetical protein